MIMETLKDYFKRRFITSLKKDTWSWMTLILGIPLMGYGLINSTNSKKQEHEYFSPNSAISQTNPAAINDQHGKEPYFISDENGDGSPDVIYKGQKILFMDPHYKGNILKTEHTLPLTLELEQAARKELIAERNVLETIIGEQTKQQ